MEDFSDVKGNEHVKRAIEVAAAGGHNLLMIGPPGSGKIMMARRIPTILPEPKILRAPHYTVSLDGLLDEAKRAEGGVLVLDDLPEFSKDALERLMHDRKHDKRDDITMLVGTMRPCACGYTGDPWHQCECTWQQVAAYRRRVPAHVASAFDVTVEVPAVRLGELMNGREGEKSEAIRERIVRARSVQAARKVLNAHLGPEVLKKYCVLDEACRALLDNVATRLTFNPVQIRAVLCVSRTIADLDGTPDIRAEHVSEAIQYRFLNLGR